MLKWYGPQIVRKMELTATEAIDDVMAKAVTHAKQNHPGWESESGKAEDSIKVLQPATVKGNKTIGIWGSLGIPYMLYLEFKRGHALTGAADAMYPQLPKTLRTKWRFAKAASRRPGFRGRR